MKVGSPDNVVGVATRQGAGWYGVRIPTGPKDTLFSKTFKICPPSSLFNAYLASFPGVKRPRREVGHSTPSSAEVKNECSCTSAPPVCLHGVNTSTLLLKVGPETAVNGLRQQNIFFHKRIQKYQQRYTSSRFNVGGYSSENRNVQRNENGAFVTLRIN
jgi:hypothetical protein